MNRKRIWWLAAMTMIAALMMVSCGSSEGTAGDGDNQDITLKDFGLPCTDNGECRSGLCGNSGLNTFCTSPCSVDNDCLAILSSSCCDAQMGFCLLPVDCQDTSTTDGDSPDTLCTADEMRCRSNDLERCTANGDWEFYRDCAADGKVCTEGACADADGDTDGDITDGDVTDGDTGCNNGARRCNGNRVEFCNVDNQWEELEDCGDTRNCDDGQCRVPVGDECTMEEGCEGDLEYCLPDRAGSQTGNCATFCDQPGVTCPRGWQCTSGICQPIDGYCRSDAECEMDEFCDRLPGASDGLCTRYCDLPGENCPELYRCVTDVQDANYGRCILSDAECSPCSYDGECGGGYYCEVVTGQTRGCCRPQCGPQNPCPGALVCDTDGRCVVGTGQGDCGGQCPPGYVCDPTFNQCVLNCPQCPENQCCDAGSAPSCYPCICTNPAICGVLLQPCCFGFNCSAVVYGVIGYCI